MKKINKRDLPDELKPYWDRTFDSSFEEEMTAAMPREIRKKRGGMHANDEDLFRTTYDGYEMAFHIPAGSEADMDLQANMLIGLMDEVEHLGHVAAFNRFAPVRRLLEKWFVEAQIEPEPLNFDLSVNTSNPRSGSCSGLDCAITKGIISPKDRCLDGQPRKQSYAHWVGRGNFVAKDGHVFGFVKGTGSPSMLGLRTLDNGESYPVITGSMYTFSQSIAYALLNHRDERQTDKYLVIDLGETLGEEPLQIRPLKSPWMSTSTKEYRRRMDLLKKAADYAESGNKIERGRLQETLD